jgi:hypothetical protein
VTPDGTLIAVPDRGLLWGNRGSLHDPAGRLVRYSRGRAWAICVLEFKGRRRQLWAPGGYRDRVRPADAAPVTVITPRATVAVLAAGYRPVIHPSAVV